jgi:hypothetical protein
MPPLKLSDQELDAIFAAARPLAQDRRDGFLQEVATALANEPGPIGPGTVHRVVAQAQRNHFDPPSNDREPSRSRWSRDAPAFERVSKQAV